MIFQLIHQLEERKYEAVSCEHFENAIRLKQAIDELITGGQTIGALDAQKSAYADEQNYSEAKEKKTESEQCRENLFKELKIAELLELPTPQKKPTSSGQRELPCLKGRRGSFTKPAVPEPPTIIKQETRKPLPPPIEKGSTRKQFKRRHIEDDSADEAYRDF